MKNQFARMKHIVPENFICQLWTVKGYKEMLVTNIMNQYTTIKKLTM